jgi:hypothetical protein
MKDDTAAPFFPQTGFGRVLAAVVGVLLFVHLRGMVVSGESAPLWVLAVDATLLLLAWWKEKRYREEQDPFRKMLLAE